MFIDILRNAENSARVTKEIITYKADGNSVKTVKKELLSLAEVYKDNSISGLFADATEPDNGIIIYKDFSPCLEVAKVLKQNNAKRKRKQEQKQHAKRRKKSLFSADMQTEKHKYKQSGSITYYLKFKATERAKKSTIKAGEIL